MADVFISYHEKSAGKLAAQIARTLESSGISCWYAKRDIPTGADFARTIPPQIDACKVFLLILNENAQTSKHIESELGLAFSRSNRGEEITIFPVEIGNFEKEAWIKYYLIHTQILKAPVLDAEHIQELARQVMRLLNRQLQPSAPLKTTPTPPTKIIECGKIIKCGECGDNVTFTLDANGVLIISGNGTMQDFEVDHKAKIHDTPWRNERKNISAVKILNGVTTIGRGAFDECAKLTNISISETVISIENFAFWGCAGLTSIHIPHSVISIGNEAFKHCTGLTSISIPDNVTSIGNFAFADCAGLTDIHIPKSVISIGDSAFRGCSKLTDIDISDSVTSIEYSTFRDCTRLISVSVPDKVTYIGKRAFENCAELVSIRIPDSVTYIGDFAFRDCGKLKSVSVPAKVKIEDDAFPFTANIERRT